MVDLAGATQAVVDRLKAGGVAATADGRDLNPPAVRVNPPQLAYRFGKGGWDATWTAVAAVPDTGHTDALRALGELLEAAQAALSYAGVSARPVDVNLEDGGTVPGYELTWTQRIT